MRHEIPIQTVHGKPIPEPLVLEVEGGAVRILIDGGFAGRDVDEELPRAAFADLLAGGPRRNHDLLGFAFETDGGEFVRGLIGVGSGNERFDARRDDLVRALGL